MRDARQLRQCKLLGVYGIIANVATALPSLIRGRAARPCGKNQHCTRHYYCHKRQRCA